MDLSQSKHELISTLRAIVACDSSLGRGTHEILEFYEAFAQKCGLKRWFPKSWKESEKSSQKIQRGAQQNLYLVSNGFDHLSESELSKLEPLFFLDHLDTVVPRYGEVEDPFDLRIESDQVKGLGVASPKVEFLAKMLALTSDGAAGAGAASSSQHIFRRPVVLAGVHGGLELMRGAVEFGRLFKGHGHLVFVGSPTHLKLCEKTKGSMKLEAKIPFELDEIEWRDSHASFQAVAESRLFKRNQQSSIAEALAFISKLPKNIGILNFESGDPFTSESGECFIELDTAEGFRFPMVEKLSKLFFALKKVESYLMTELNSAFQPAFSTLTLTQVKSTESHLTLQCVVDSVPTERSGEISVKAFEVIKKEIEAVGGSVELIRGFKPTGPFPEAPERQELQEVLERVGLNPEYHSFSQCNESSILEALGFRCLSFGAGKAYNQSHQAPSVESLALPDFQKAVEFYREIVRRFCL